MIIVWQWSSAYVQKEKVGSFRHDGRTISPSLHHLFTVESGIDIGWNQENQSHFDLEQPLPTAPSAAVSAAHIQRQ